LKLIMAKMGATFETGTVCTIPICFWIYARCQNIEMPPWSLVVVA
jgi:hypothetical protein